MSDDASDVAGTDLLPLLADGDEVHADAESSGLELDDHQSREIQQIFGSALPQYLQPVEEMVEQLLTGAADADTLRALNGTITSLALAALRMGFQEVHDLLDQLRQHIGQFDASEPVAARARDVILADLLRLTEFASSMGAQPEASRSETIFSAFADVADLGADVLNRLSSAGLVTVDQLRVARPDEVAAVTGLDDKSVQRLLAHVGCEEGPRRRRAARASSETPAWSHGEREATAARSRPDAAASVVDDDQMSADKPNVVDLPLDVETLRRTTSERIEAQVDAEVRVEKARTDMQKLRAQIKKMRATLGQMTSDCGDQHEALEELASRVERRVETLNQVRLQYQALLRDCLASEEEVRNRQEAVSQLRRKRARLREDAHAVELQIEELVARLGQVRRRAIVRTHKSQA